MTMQDIDWAAMTRTQHEASFNMLVVFHDDMNGRLRIGEGHDNGDLFDISRDINKAMHAANDDLARREAELTEAIGGTR